MTNPRTFKNILITGANRGIGLEFVRQYIDESEKIFACCRTPENAYELNKLAQLSEKIEIIPLDVTNEHQIMALQQRLAQEKLDLLINNAGVYPEPRTSLDKNLWLDTLNVNSLSPIHLTLALKGNLSHGQAIVANITSKMGSIADNSTGGVIIYRTSKAALNAATRSLALDNAEEFTTLLLHPGWVQTDMGGPNALINVGTSVNGMRRVIADADNSYNSGFYNYDGSPIPW